jgi:hypothetical protein
MAFRSEASTKDLAGTSAAYVSALSGVPCHHGCSRDEQVDLVRLLEHAYLAVLLVPVGHRHVDEA